MSLHRVSSLSKENTKTFGLGQHPTPWPDTDSMNDIAPNHPARHCVRSCQSHSKELGPLLDGELAKPIRVLQEAPEPAFTPRVAN